jgi:hypothetical protein
VSDGPEEPPLAREFIDALRTLSGEVQGLRDDLGRIYGRDAAGRLLAVAPPSGGPAHVPVPPWTPNDVKDVIGSIFGVPRKRRRR